MRHSELYNKVERLCLLLPAALLIVALQSCISDDSTYGDDSYQITISGIDDTYSMMSFNGDELTISPEVSSNFDESDLTYEWYYYEGQTDDRGNRSVKKNVIGTDRQLNYQSELPDGTYDFIFAVKSKSTGYTVTENTYVTIATALSTGFYILKETADGNSDLDLYVPSRDELTTDILTRVQGQPVAGRPVHLDVVTKQPYVDSLTTQRTFGTTLCVTTDAGKVRWISTSDGRTVKSEADCHYGANDGEQFYRTVRTSQVIYLLSSTGVYTVSPGTGTGTFGTTYANGASTHAIQTSNFQLLFWNNGTSSLQMVDYNGYTASVVSRAAGYRAAYTPYNCLYCGRYTGDRYDIKEYLYFILADKQDPAKRVIYHLTTNYSMAFIEDVREVAADSPLAQATLFATCERQGKLGYCVAGNQLYSYSLEDTALATKALTLNGIDSGETITYLANKAQASTVSYDYLVVGTQQGDTYRVRFYELVGGEPTGDPVYTITGQGRLRNINYTAAGSWGNLAGGEIVDD